MTVVSEYKNKSYVTKYFNNGVERLHTDGKLEDKPIDINIHNETTPDTLQHYRFEQRINCTLVEPVRVMLEA